MSKTHEALNTKVHTFAAAMKLVPLLLGIFLTSEFSEVKRYHTRWCRKLSKKFERCLTTGYTPSFYDGCSIGPGFVETRELQKKCHWWEGKLARCCEYSCQEGLIGPISSPNKIEGTQENGTADAEVGRETVATSDDGGNEADEKENEIFEKEDIGSEHIEETIKPDDDKKKNKEESAFEAATEEIGPDDLKEKTVSTDKEETETAERATEAEEEATEAEKEETKAEGEATE